MGKSLYQKIFESHTVAKLPSGQCQLFIGLHLCHEVTSPQAFAQLREEGQKVLFPERTFATVDHIIPTTFPERNRPLQDGISEEMFSHIENNTKNNGIKFFGPATAEQGVIHIVGPEEGVTQPGMTVACGDSHTATHGAFGAIAFGIGTSQVADVLATQTLAMSPLKTRRIKFTGKLKPGVTAKDVALAYIAKLGVNGGVGYAYEFAGPVIEEMGMEGRMTVCNMAIEGGARVGYCNPDEKTFEYIKGKPYAPKGEEWDKAVAYWRTLKSGDDAVFDKEVRFDAANIAPMITYGTNPGMGMAIDASIPQPANASDVKALEYMQFNAGEQLLGHPVDYVFLGACTNGRIEDFRAFAGLVKGRKKAPSVTAWLVPGSWLVLGQIKAEGLDKILEEAGFEIRQPGCSACLAMNDDKIPAGCLSVSTSNRNFEGRQGPGSRTCLASPLTAAAAAVTGVITDPRTLM